MIMAMAFMKAIPMILSRVTSVATPGTITNTFVYIGLDTRVGMTDSTGTMTFKRSDVGIAMRLPAEVGLGLKDWGVNCRQI